MRQEKEPDLLLVPVLLGLERRPQHAWVELKGRLSLQGRQWLVSWRNWPLCQAAGTA